MSAFEPATRDQAERVLEQADQQEQLKATPRPWATGEASPTSIWVGDEQVASCDWSLSCPSCGAEEQDYRAGRAAFNPREVRAANAALIVAAVNERDQQEQLLSELARLLGEFTQVLEMHQRTKTHPEWEPPLRRAVRHAFEAHGSDGVLAVVRDLLAMKASRPLQAASLVNYLAGERQALAREGRQS